MNRRGKKVLLGTMAVIFSASLFGCSTIKGVGNDISTVGGWISGSSDHVKESVQKNPPGSGMEK